MSLAAARSTQPLPGRCGLVAAGLPSVSCPGPAGRGRGSAGLVRGRARGDHPPLRAGDGQAAGRAGGGECCLRHRRVLCRPGPGAVHRLDAAGALRRRQGDRDAAPGAAPENRQSRRPPWPDADPADPRRETLPQADGHLGLRLRHRAITAPPARHHRPARRPARPPHAAAPAQSHGEMAGRIGAARSRRGDRRRVRPGRGPRPAAPAHLGGPGRRSRAPARPDPRRSRPPRRHHPHRDRLHPRTRVHLESRMVPALARRPRSRGLGRGQGTRGPGRRQHPGRRRDHQRSGRRRPDRRPPGRRRRVRPLPHRQPRPPALRPGTGRGLAHRHRRHRRSLPPPDRRPARFQQ